MVGKYRSIPKVGTTLRFVNDLSAVHQTDDVSVDLSPHAVVATSVKMTVETAGLSAACSGK